MVRPSYAGLGGNILFLGSRQFPGENQQNRDKSAVFRLKKEKIYALNTIIQVFTDIRRLAIRFFLVAFLTAFS